MHVGLDVGHVGVTRIPAGLIRIYSLAVLNWDIPILPIFKVGDYVQCVAGLASVHMLCGCVVRVIANEGLAELMMEYEVEFSVGYATLYGTQLRLLAEDRAERGARRSWCLRFTN